MHVSFFVSLQTRPPGGGETSNNQRKSQYKCYRCQWVYSIAFSWLVSYPLTVHVNLHTFFSWVKFLKYPWDEGNYCMVNTQCHVCIICHQMLLILRPHLLQFLPVLLHKYYYMICIQSTKSFYSILSIVITMGLGIVINIIICML